ncbi:MAG: hypothetical protein ACJARI_003965 [Bacteroidia bacterium]|jgi:hypothetical protein
MVAGNFTAAHRNSRYTPNQNLGTLAVLVEVAEKNQFAVSVLKDITSTVYILTGIKWHTHVATELSRQIDHWPG